MIGCLRTRVRKQPIIALYFESEIELQFYNLEARICFISFIVFQVADRARKHGIGRHPGEEVHKIGCGDIQAISTFLGSKPYLMGDNPSLVRSTAVLFELSSS